MVVFFIYQFTQYNFHYTVILNCGGKYFFLSPDVSVESLKGFTKNPASFVLSVEQTKTVASLT